MKLTSATVVPTGKPTLWSHAWNVENLYISGFFENAKLTTEELETQSQELVSLVFKIYNENTESAPFLAIKSIVNEASLLLKKRGIDLSLSAGMVINGLIYVSVVGMGEAYLLRDSNLIKLTAGKSGVGQFSLSGKLKESDVILLSVGSHEKVLEGNLAEALRAGDAQEISKKLTNIVGGESYNPFTVLKLEEGESVPRLVDNTEAPVILNPMPPKKSLFEKFMAGGGRRIRTSEVNFADAKKKKSMLTLGSFLLVLLIVSIVLGARQKSQKSAEDLFTKKTEEIRQNLDEAKALFTLSPEKAKELFSKSESIVEELATEFPKDVRVDEFKKLVEGSRGAVLGEFTTGVSEYLDLSLIEDFEGASMAGTLENLYVFDGNKKRIVEVAIDTKKTEVVAGPSQIGSMKDWSAYNGRIYLLEEDGIYEVGKGRAKVTEKDWEGEAMLTAYAGNLYVLDKSNSEILRYSAISSGFAPPKNWLAPGISPNLSGATSWTIDGSVWLLNSPTKIQKYTSGSPKNLSELRVTPILTNPSELYTNEESLNVYILDPVNSRIVTMDKEGNYKAQYKADEIKGAIGVVVNESQGKLFFATKEKLYVIEMSN